MKTLAFTSILLTCGLACAQSLYVNAGGTNTNPALGTGTLSRSGAPAPASTQWSELASEFGAANIAGGFAGHRVNTADDYRLADDFTVTGNAWNITGFSFFAYEPVISTITSPVIAVNLQIWNGEPGTLGATVIWGNTGTNIATVSSNSGFLRIFSSNTLPFPMTPDSARVIWRVEVPATLTLQPGTYWLDWQFIARGPSFTVFSPTATVLNVREPAGANALQKDGTWAALVDEGRPAGAANVSAELPFAVLGGIDCPADIDNSGGVDGDDAIAFFALWEVSNMDFNNDGGTDGDDVIAFFSRWDGGC
jgi:hypothetical protein